MTFRINAKRHYCMTEPQSEVDLNAVFFCVHRPVRFFVPFPDIYELLSITMHYLY